MTNAEMLKSLPLEELAKALNAASTCPAWIKWTEWKCPSIDCNECWLNWLKTEFNGRY